MERKALDVAAIVISIAGVLLSGYFSLDAKRSSERASAITKLATRFDVSNRMIEMLSKLSGFATVFGKPPQQSGPVLATVAADAPTILWFDANEANVNAVYSFAKSVADNDTGLPSDLNDLNSTIILPLLSGERSNTDPSSVLSSIYTYSRIHELKQNASTQVGLADFSRAKLYHARCDPSFPVYLHGFDLTKTKWQGATFGANCKVDGAVMDGADLAQIGTSEVGEAIRWKDVRLVGASIIEPKNSTALINPIASGCYIRDTNQELTIEGTPTALADLRFSKIEIPRSAKVHFHHVDLSGADLRNFDLTSPLVDLDDVLVNWAIINQGSEPIAIQMVAKRQLTIKDGSSTWVSKNPAAIDLSEQLTGDGKVETGLGKPLCERLTSFLDSSRRDEVAKQGMKARYGDTIVSQNTHTSYPPLDFCRDYLATTYHGD